MIDTAMDQEHSWFTWGERDCWPFVRMLIVAFVLGAAAHRFAGWTINVRHLLRMPGQVLGVLSILAMISFALAELYLLLFAIPLYLISVFNDWFYNGSRAFCSSVLRMRSRALLCVAGLCGEITLFGLLIYLLNGHLISRF